ncbi:MAG: flagellar hook-basal body protein [Schaedlerella sp.]|uniref:flagellar hook-basal body protein n=1 Tax=Schaedlerella sp. TaxID=2676057 RepID=UPI00272BF47A|nr:flagellar hook-basal body protein [uncultured Schaedlerella sp.]
MYQGFYDLASNMITQNRNLNIISNNMSNVSTPGYKMDRMMESTFRDEILYRYDQNGKTAVGPISHMNVADERVTDYTEGGIRETGYPLDVGLTGDGFFVIETENGEVYTRNGSFNLNNQGYLILPGMGRVMGTNGPIQVDTDDLAIDTQGRITNADDGRYYGTLEIVDFADYAQLTKVTGGVFQAAEDPIAARNTVVTQKYLEDSNVNLAEQMTAMMSSQRVLQGSAQILRMYDQMISRSTTLGSPS